MGAALHRPKCSTFLVLRVYFLNNINIEDEVHATFKCNFITSMLIKHPHRTTCFRPLVISDT